MDSPRLYVARLISVGEVRQQLEFEADSAEAAWMEGNDGVDPLKGLWVEVTKKKDPQQRIRL